MWALENRTPFSAERAWVRALDGAEIWLVAVKASFEWDDDARLSIAGDQVPVMLAPVFVGTPGASSLRYESDLQRTKLTTDVLLLGQAHAPGGRPVERLDVGLAVGDVVKKLVVHGERRWRGTRIERAEPFIAMPLNYERAYGGADPQSATPAWDTRNPVGRGYIASAGHADGKSLPNVEDPGSPIARWNDRPVPAGFGPLACHWHDRLRWAGTYDERWQKERLPLLPADFDDRHYQCAPADQQAPRFLRGGELVTLRNLVRGGGERRFALPRVHIGLETFFFTGPSVLHEPPRLHTVIIEPELRRLSLVWHSALPCHTRVLKLQRTRILVKEDLRAGAMLAPATAGA